MTWPVLQADWSLVRQLYAEDRIIEMKTTGHNRGGLLVEHDGLAGFVPFHIWWNWPVGSTKLIVMNA